MLRSRQAICAITPFDGKCQNLPMSPTTFLRQLLPFQRYKNFYLQKVSQGDGVNFRNYTIR